MRKRPTILTTRHAAAVAVLSLVAVACLGAAPAAASDYAYWYALPSTRVMRETRAPSLDVASTRPTGPTMYLSAAQDEFEGYQVVVRPTASTSDYVIAPSDLVQQTGVGAPAGVIPASEVSVHWVVYHKITVPSTGQRTRIGSYYPDALPPMKLMSGKLVPRGVSGNVTQPFYVLFHVPAGTAAGTYAGTLTITAAGSPSVTVPVSLRVWGFSIASRTLRTHFGFSLRCARYFSNDQHRFPVDPDGTQYGGQTLTRWMIFFNEHRISPGTMVPGFWTPYNSDGTMYLRKEFVDDYVGTGPATTYAGQRLNFNSLPMPDKTFVPTYVNNPFTSATARSRAINYYRSMRDTYGSNWTRALIYPIDEPFARDRTRVQNYGALIHSALPGAKFMVTTDPSRFSFTPLKNVDVYVHKLHFWYRDQKRWIRPLKRRGKTFWVYSHTTPHQHESPLYLIDKPINDSRVQGWFAYHTNTRGLLYFSTNRWVNAYNKNYFRDPYTYALSIRIREYTGAVDYSNGDGSLLYPGYYPRLGLDEPGAGPVSSLRMEALRDGLEDYEYLKLLERKKGRALALLFVAKILKTTRYRGHFPDYSTSAYRYRQVRESIARLIEGP